jgi:hypothetical protein
MFEHKIIKIAIGYAALEKHDFKPAQGNSNKGEDKLKLAEFLGENIVKFLKGERNIEITVPPATSEYVPIKPLSPKEARDVYDKTKSKVQKEFDQADSDQDIQEILSTILILLREEGIFRPFDDKNEALKTKLKKQIFSGYKTPKEVNLADIKILDKLDLDGNAENAMWYFNVAHLLIRAHALLEGFDSTGIMKVLKQRREFQPQKMQIEKKILFLNVVKDIKKYEVINNTIKAFFESALGFFLKTDAMLNSILNRKPSDYKSIPLKELNELTNIQFEGRYDKQINSLAVSAECGKQISEEIEKTLKSSNIKYLSLNVNEDTKLFIVDNIESDEQAKAIREAYEKARNSERLTMSK